MMSHQLAGLIVVAKDESKFGFTELQRINEDGLKYRLQLAGRRTDNAQYLRGCGLLIQRFAEIIRAFPQLVEQPRVLDGDDGLGGEGLDQLDLFRREVPRLEALEGHDANQIAFPQQRHTEGSSKPD